MDKRTTKDGRLFIDGYECGDELDYEDRDGGHDAARIMEQMIVFGGVSGVGFMTNPRKSHRQPWIEVNGEKVVCTAQGGECRYNRRYYSPGMNDEKSWTTPIVDHSCPDRCCYKVLVCDGHEPHCEGSIHYYPQYNKFRGLFEWYCHSMERIQPKEV